MPKQIKFPLEYQRDEITNKSEVERLEEISNKKGNTVSKTARDYVLEGMKKDEYMLSMTPKLDQFIGKAKPEEYVPMEPTLADSLSIHSDFISESKFSIEELDRRQFQCMRLQKIYVEQILKERKQLEEPQNQKFIKYIKELKSRESGTSVGSK